MAEVFQSVALPAVFDLDALDAVRDRLTEALDNGPVDVTASGVERIATNALLMLLSAGQTARRSGSAMTISAASAPFRAAMERLGLHHAFAPYVKG